MTVAVRIIPCLDVAGGRVVKGVNFVELKDAGDPVEQARIYDAQAADELCFQIGRAQSELQSLMRISYAVFCVRKQVQHDLRRHLQLKTKAESGNTDLATPGAPKQH